jgi:hypothetical protein
METKTKVEALAMIWAAQRKDAEQAHIEADEALCGFLEHLGHGDLVKAWNDVPKWYS